jgi:formiminotetrahydrofolate cyclodeaminase
MSEMKDQSVQFYLDELASKQATPGGGSAAALMGAQAAALISMVCNLTLGKPKYAAVEADLQALLLSSEQLRSTLTGMIKTDIEVFDKLMSSYALPKTTDDEKAQRSVRIQAVLKEATQVPLDCAKACAKTLALSRIAAEKGNAGVVSDAGVALMSAYSGLKSAALNVYINAAGLKDREFAEEKLAELQEISQDVETEVASIYALVKERL